MLDLVVDHILGDLGRHLLYLDALVVLDLDLRLNNNGRLEGKAVLRNFLSLKRGDSDHLEACFLSGFVQRGGIAILHRVVIEDLRAVHLLDDHAGSFALAEAGYVDFLDFLLVYLVNSGAESFAVYADFYFIGVCFFQSG